MKISEAFYSTVELITEFTAKIFGFGFDSWPDNYLAIPLYLFGQAAKYVIGYPVGALAGGFAVIFTAIYNLVYPEPPQNALPDDIHNSTEDEEKTSTVQQELKIQLDHDPELTDQVSPENEKNRPAVMTEDPSVPVNKVIMSDDRSSESEQMSPLPSIDNPVIEYESSAPVTINEQKTLEAAYEQERVEQNNRLEKRNSIENNIQKLNQKIDEQIIPVESGYKNHKATLSLISQLESRLWKAKNKTTLITSYETKNKEVSETINTCLCGLSRGYRCPQCKQMPVISKTNTKTIRVQVPVTTTFKSIDEYECQSIKNQISSESEKLLLTKEEYRTGTILYSAKNRLEKLSSELNENGQSDLTKLRRLYLEILSDITPCFSESEDFKPQDFMPKSDYAQMIVSTVRIRQLTRENQFFQMLPGVLREKIAFSTVSSEFPIEDGRHIFKN